MNSSSSPHFGDFTQQAESYARARPSYPPALVETLLSHAGVRAGDTVVDLGAGTGLFTRLLSGRGFRITALEPNQAMREQAAPLPDVRWRDGSFEATGLPDAAQAWAVAAQAFHWAKPERALPELRRILQPGKWLTLLWNNRQNKKNPILAWTSAAISRHIPEFEHGYRDGNRGRDWASVLVSTGDFTDVVRHETEHVTPMHAERYVELWRSHNRLTITAGAQRLEAFLAEVRAYLARERIETVDVPYRCTAWSARRK